jgi:outer membrane protein assembly factor BamD (BamD/ComL family)
MSMRSKLPLSALALATALAIGSPAWAQTAIELKKDLFPKYKKAKAEGKDLGEAGELYEKGDAELRKGMQEEAIEYFTQAKDAWPAE